MHVELGIPGLRLSLGDHVCAFYRGRSERDEILIPYLRQGLQAGDKCICVVDATKPDTVLTPLTDEIGSHNLLGAQQIDVFASRETYTEERFRTQTMIGFWDQLMAAALRDPGFSFVRVAGEMTWAMRNMPGGDELMAYESEINRFMPQYPQVILCLYDLERFSGELVVGIMKTHPKVLVGGAVVENPYYIDPDALLAAQK